MQRNITRAFVGLFMGVAFAATSAPLRAQSMEVKEKAALYTYVSNWQVPRAKWADWEKPNVATEKAMTQGVSSGTLVAYGVDKVEVHNLEGATHDSFWSAMSMSALLDVLDALAKGPSDALLLTATKHSDAIYVSHYYNWKPGTYKGAYTHTAYYKFKDSAPDDAVDVMSKNFVVPLMEKLLADGSIIEYEVDEEAIHTESPNDVWIDYITPNSAGLDKVSAAIQQMFKANAFAGLALGGMGDSTAHRDYLSHSNITYK